MVGRHVLTSVSAQIWFEPPAFGVGPEKAVSAGLIMNTFLGIGKGTGMLKVRPISTDLFECSRIVLVFTFIPKPFTYNRWQCVSTCYCSFRQGCYAI